MPRYHSFFGLSDKENKKIHSYLSSHNITPDNFYYKLLLEFKSHGIYILSKLEAEGVLDESYYILYKSKKFAEQTLQKIYTGLKELEKIKLQSEAIQQQVKEKKIKYEILKASKHFMDNKNTYHQGIKKEILDDLMNKIHQLHIKNNQPEKLDALCKIYHSLKIMNLSSMESINEYKKTIVYNLKKMESFDSFFGKMCALIMHSIFPAYHGILKSNTRLLIEKAENFVEENNFPGERRDKKCLPEKH